MPPTLDPNTTVPVVPPRTYPGAKRGRKPRNDSTTTPLPTLTPSGGSASASGTTAIIAPAATPATSTPSTPAVGATTAAPTTAAPSYTYRPATATPGSGSATPSYVYQTPPLKLAPPHVQVGNASNSAANSAATTPNSAATASTQATTSAALPPTAATATAVPVQHPYYATPGTVTTSYAHYYANPSNYPSQYSRPPVPISVPATTATAAAVVTATTSTWPTTTTGTTSTLSTAPSVPLALPGSTGGLLTPSYTPSTGYTYTPAPGTTAQTYLPRYSLSGSHSAHPVIALSPAATAAAAAAQSQILRAVGASAGAVPIIANPSTVGATGASTAAGGTGAGDEDEEGEEHELPFMSDDVYGQGLLWQSQSKENLKVLMDHFTPEQFERYEAYRRSAFQKQSVRKVIQQATPYTVSQPVAQVVAGFAKVFVGEIIEKAREVQAKYNSQDSSNTNNAENEPLSPEHIREAYRLYQFETGKIGAARVHKGRKMFVR